MLDISLQLGLLEKHNVERIVGIDEVGRGAWAGPVVIGAFVWTPQAPFIEAVRDSKLIKLPERENLAQQLASNVHSFASSSAVEVDEYGITRRIEQNIVDLVNEFDDSKTLFVIDGYFKYLPQAKIIQASKADNTYYAVAAAAILAKVYRDNLMAEFAKQFAGYGWETNRGYGTGAHAKAIQQLGITELHRKTFVPANLIV